MASLILPKVHSHFPRDTSLMQESATASEMRLVSLPNSIVKAVECLMHGRRAGSEKSFLYTSKAQRV